MMRIAFAIEDQLGHRALLSNLQRVLSQEKEAVTPVWYPVDPRGEGILATRRLRDKHALVFGVKMRKVMRTARNQRQVDAFFIHTQRMAHLSVDLMRRIPSFLSIDATPRELDELYRPLSGLQSQEGGIYWKIRDAIHRRTYGAARGMISMSERVANTLSTVYRVSPEKILVLLPGVDTDLWRPLSAPSPDRKLRLLFVGGEFERKGGPLLLRWLRETARRDFSLDIVTQSPVDPMPGVTVHGQFKPGETGLVDLVRRADLLVHPTRADTSAWVIAEAKSAATAVLSTRVGGIPELVREGVDGHIVPPNDYEAFAQRLESMVSNRQLLAEYSVRAREDALARMDAKINARKLLNFMRVHLGEEPFEWPSSTRFDVVRTVEVASD